MARKVIPKETREKVYNKYEGHCAYCGCKLEYKDMQVDHIESVRIAELKGKEIDNSLNNLMPSCRQCNFYKGTSSIDQFRKNITKTLLPNLQKNFNYRLALKYGLIKENIKPVLFYYELKYFKQD